MTYIEKALADPAFSGKTFGVVSLLGEMRSRNGLSQDALARRIGAASKAVVYQWESR